MIDGKLQTVLRRMGTVEQMRALRQQGDAALLGRFRGDNDEAAFEILVQRHGPMVLGVCRRILADSHDAEDAFQATFLLLARRAATIRKAAVVGAWLHAVACQVAQRARKARSQRGRFQVLAEFEVGQTEAAEADGLEWRELRPVLDEELGRLPDKYRAPVVLCYLEDRSNAEAAEQLGWPVGTVKGRLARARSLLQTRLARRGVALGAGLFATTAGSGAVLAASVPPVLTMTTVYQAIQMATGTAPALAGVAPAVATLFSGGLQAMRFAKIKVIGALFALLGLCAFPGSTTANRDQAAKAIGAGVPWRRRRLFFRGGFHTAGTTRQRSSSSICQQWSVKPAAIAGVRSVHCRPPVPDARTRRLSCGQHQL